MSSYYSLNLSENHSKIFWIFPEEKVYSIKNKQLLQLHKVEFSLLGAQASYQQESGIVPLGTIILTIWEVTGIFILEHFKFFWFWRKQLLT